LNQILNPSHIFLSLNVEMEFRMLMSIVIWEYEVDLLKMVFYLKIEERKIMIIMVGNVQINVN
jgi:hypothetical protein